MFTLRPYQSNIINDTRLALREHNSVLIQAPTGSGKTALSAAMAGSASKKNKRTFFICHRQELIEQTSITFNKVGIPHGFIAAGIAPDPFQTVQICSIDTLKSRVAAIKHPDFCIWDECFPAGTKIDGINIEDLKKGNKVKSYNHSTNEVELKKITHIFKNRSRWQQLLKLNFENGESIVTTLGHPFYIKDRGYCQAFKVLEGEYVCKLSLVQDRNRSENKISKRQTEKSRAYLLFKKMFQCLSLKNLFKNYGKDKQEICLGTDEEKQSNEERSYQGESKQSIKGNESQTSCKGRQWNSTDNSGTNDVRYNEKVWDESTYGICRCDWIWCKINRYANALQDRLGIDRHKSSNRDRRKFSQLFRETGIGSEKGYVFDFIRVDSVEILEQTSDGTFGCLCPDGFVYNIEVEGNNNYFANDILVHNCHHVGASGWSKIHGLYSKARHVGLTATPERLDGKGLGEWFSHMVLGPTPAWLIKAGYLSDYDYFAPNVPDLTGVHTKMGDFKKDELTHAMDSNVITGDAIKHYLKYAMGKRAVVFCVGIKHSLHVVEQFKAAGIMAVHIDGTMNRIDRKAAIDGFRTGAIQILCNVDIVGEGFDLPAIEASILLRPTQSMGLFLQQVGRALRPKEKGGKAVILDHAGNYLRHGFPDDEREWTLEGHQRKGRGKKDEAEEVNIRQCPKCFMVHRPSPRCPGCGHIYEIKSRELDQVDEDLVELDRDAIRKQRRQEQGRASTIDDLVELAIQRGYKSPHAWAAHIWTAREAKKKGYGG